jgi:L-iditol 2-dehydrogenase
VARGQRLARFAPGQSVLVIGSGISGLLHVQLAKARGAALVAATDVNAFRLKAAKRLGADEAIHAGDDVPSRLRELNDGRLADLVIVSTGATPAMLQALECVDRGGTLLFFAPTAAGATVPIPMYELWRNEITATTSYAASPQDLLEAMALIRSGAIRTEEMITHRLSLAEAALAFRLVAEAQDSIKVLLEPQRG